MSLFAFPTPEANDRMPFGKVNIPFTDWNSFRFTESVSQLAGNRLYDTYEEISDTSPHINPDYANQMYGVGDIDGLPGSGLKFDKPVREQTAGMRQQRKLIELQDMNVRELAAHSGIGAKAVGSFVFGALPGSMAHPLDFMVNLIPFVGSGAKAATVAKMGGGAFKQAMARGLIAEEQIAFRYPALAGSVINGAFGNAIAEIPVAIQNFRDQRIYGLEDSAANVSMGGIAGGALHIAGRGLTKAFDMVRGASEETKTRMVKTALAQAMNGEEIDVSHVIAVDREAIRTAAQFDEVAARESALLEAKSKYTEESAKVKALLDTANIGRANSDDLLRLLTISEKSASNPVDAKIAARLLKRFQEVDRSVDLFKQAAQLFELQYDPTVKSPDAKGASLEYGSPIGNEKVVSAREAKSIRGQIYEVEKVLKEILERQSKESDPLVQRQLSTNAHRLQLERDALIQKYEKLDASMSKSETGLTPDESLAHAEEMSKRGELISVDEVTRKAKQIQDSIDEKTARMADEILANQRQQYDAKAVEQKKLTEAIRQQQQLGKVLSDEDLKTFGTKETIKPEDISVLEQDARNLAQSLGGAAPAENQKVEVSVRKMKNGRAVNGTVQMDQKSALKALEGRATILRKLIDCLGG